MLYQGQIRFLSPFKERGSLHVTEAGIPVQSILSYVSEVAGQPAKLGPTTTRGPLSRASTSLGAPRLSPCPMLQGS